MFFFFFFLYLDGFNLLTNDKVSCLSKIICWFGRIPMLSLWPTGTAWLLQVCLDLVLLDQLDTSGMWIYFVQFIYQFSSTSTRQIVSLYGIIFAYKWSCNSPLKKFLGIISVK